MEEATRVFMIDDEQTFYNMVARQVKGAGYVLEYARSGEEALKHLAGINPDIIILDLNLKDMSGFDILRRLRRDPRFNQIPVIFLTSQSKLEDKLQAFELGADDYMVKPFEPEELIARLGILNRRSRAAKIAMSLEEDKTIMPTDVVAVHSLRGGVGTSSLATNLALAFQSIWERHTLLVDGVFAAGQLSMMLDVSPRNTWASFADVSVEEMDENFVDELVSSTDDGLHLVAAPRVPVAMDNFSHEFFESVFTRFKEKHDFVVIDCAHDFSDATLSMLLQSTTILSVLAPEMASLRAALSALEIYKQLGIAPEAVKLVLNNNTDQVGLKRLQMERVLGRPFDFEIPFEPEEVFRALNMGRPFLLEKPDLPVSMQIADIAYNLSSELLKNIPPATPSQAWKRVVKRASKSG